MTRALLLALLLQGREVPGPKLVLVPAGEYQRGSDGNAERSLRKLFPRHAIPGDGEDLASETPRHPVKITKAFHLGATEVTVAQFRAFVEATSHVTDAEKKGARGFLRAKGEFESGPAYTWKTPGFPQGDDHPVVCVSWNDATAYCEWLGRREKAVYRLPTEAEWEYACRAGTQGFLNFGDDPALAPKHANLADVALEKAHPGMTMRQQVVDVAKDPADGHVYTASVGRFPPNAFGLHDLHGNVWEWCRDRYQRFAYKPFEPRKMKTAVVDPQGPEKADEHGDWRVLRGGSWAVDAVSARASSRLWNDAGDAFCYAGFRVLRELP